MIQKLIVAVIALALLIIIVTNTLIIRGIPFVDKIDTKWAIGIYVGKSPFNLSPGNIKNPVLTYKDVTDTRAVFVTDPFMVYEDDTWYMFFEVWNKNTNQGDIAFASSNDGLNWIYEQIVLDESFHLSYPYVFKWQGEYYMIPESSSMNSIRLYKAIKFPTKWSYVGLLLKGEQFKDSSIFRYDNRWWLFAETSPEKNKFNTLRLYYANALMGPWVEHLMSPIIEGDANIARPGGRVINYDNNVIRFTQDDDPIYGSQVRAFRITELTTTSYKEEEVSENPILGPSGTGWNAKRMHHIDLHHISRNQWIASVDGYGEKLIFGLKY